VVGWLFGLFRGLELRSLEMRLRLGAPFRASFWVAFGGCSLEHTNGGHQCWGLMVGCHRTPRKEKKALNRKPKVAWRMMHLVANQSPPWGARAGLFIREVKDFITMT
jgi:hypothetical protein